MKIVLLVGAEDAAMDWRTLLIVRVVLDNKICGKQWKKYRQYAQITDLKHRDVI